jgi:hypothetical protein
MGALSVQWCWNNGMMQMIGDSNDTGGEFTEVTARCQEKAAIQEDAREARNTKSEIRNNS